MHAIVSSIETNANLHSSGILSAPTIVQVNNKGQIIGHGQQYIITTTSKLNNPNEQLSSASTVISAPSTDVIALPNNDQTIQTVYPVHYIENDDSVNSYADNNGKIDYIELNSVNKPHVKAILATSNKSGQFQDYNVQYTNTGSGTTYYQNSLGQLREVSTVQQLSSVPNGAQIVMHQGNTFLLQGATLDDQSGSIAHTTRASPATVQWLIDNYETAEGVSLPRSTLYNHYLRHCHEHKIDPMNPASFGKLIRSVFFGLRTRRLGTRGNSKYHYYGIRIKLSSPLNQYQDDQSFNMRHYPFVQNKRFKSSTKYESEYGNNATANHSSHSTVAAASTPNHATFNEETHQHQQFLGDASSALPSLGEVHIPEGCLLPDGITEDDVQNFVDLYMEHCESILDTVVNLQFSLVEVLWQQFWRTALTGNIEEDKKLPKDTLAVLCSFEPVRDFVRDSDYTFYQSLVEVLIPTVLRPIPSSLTQAIRNFAKSLEGWMRASLRGIDEAMVAVKLNAVGAFAQTLRRYTSLNHLAQAARAVLTNSNQISQMLADLNRVDFDHVQEQASWVCGCEPELICKLEQDFKRILQQQTSLEQWAVWLDNVVSAVLQPYIARASFPRSARQFLLKWSFYSSMVIRDLTLRSAASFGSFHLIRLLYDEYMFFLVEHKVAAHLEQTPIAVMAELGKGRLFDDDEDGREEEEEEEESIQLHRQVYKLGGQNGLMFKIKSDESGCKSTSHTTSIILNGGGGLVTSSAGATYKTGATYATTKTISTSEGNKTLVVIQPDATATESGAKRIKLISS